MDRFTALGLIMDAQLNPGKLIAVVAPRFREVRQALEAAATAAVIIDGVKVRRADGEERIQFPNGSLILFRSARQSLRGRVLDVVLVHADVPRHILSEDQWHRWLRETEPALASRRGEVVLSW